LQEAASVFPSVARPSAVTGVGYGPHVMQINEGAALRQGNPLRPRFGKRNHSTSDHLLSICWTHSQVGALWLAAQVQKSNIVARWGWGRL